MKTSLNHLPENKQDELKELTKIFESSKKVVMVLLFGSYARGTWIQDRYLEKGVIYEYESDYDILVLLTNEDITLQNHFENRIKTELVNKGLLKTPVSLILHGIDQVNEALSDGHYFFSDIKKEGIALVDKGKIKLLESRILSPAELQKKAQEDFDQWYTSAKSFIRHYNVALEENDLYISAFLLHQATERLYVAILLVFTGYRPKTHSLESLSLRAEMLNEQFKNVFPRETEEDNNLFRLLHKAYIDARYKMDTYQITEQHLEYLGERVKFLQKITKKICLAKIKEFGSQ